MATQPPAATASLRALGLRGNDREVEAVNRGRVESTTPSMEQSEESEESEAEDDNAAISVDQVSVSFHPRLLRNKAHVSGQGLAKHPKTEPYKIFVNPSPVLNPTKDWGYEFISTYNGFAKAAKETDDPMYVASKIKFDPAYGGRVVRAESKEKEKARRPHEPALLAHPPRRSYTNWITGLQYKDEADWTIAVEDRIEKILKGEAFNDDPLTRKKNWLKQPFSISLFAALRTYSYAAGAFNDGAASSVIHNNDTIELTACHRTF